VLEAVCTKCNPALAAVFQAKGDWCATHGFPESFCPVCHPEKGGRPAVDVKAERAPAEGRRIRFKSRASAELAGIQTAAASEALASGGLQVVGRIVPDATRVAHVNARAPGVLRQLVVDVGARVSKADTLAVIESAAAGQAQARIRASEARVSAARTQHERERSLLEKRVSSAREVMEARQALEEAEAELAAARAELGVLESVDGSGRYRLRAPLSGLVTERHASVGQLVGEDEPLFVVMDPSVAWVEVDVPESALGSVRAGQHVGVEVDALPGRTFEGTLDYIAPVIDPATRTAKGRVPIANPDGALRANMLARAFVDTGVEPAAALVPLDALQSIDDVEVVFVQLAPDEFEVRRVESGPRQGSHVRVLEGVSPGDRVATSGSFLLKTEVLKSSIGSGCCEVD
jgi:cobalt-zinc-cadmium efflux system membrane fusion protein